MTADLVRELKAPWDSFFIDVPHGILPYPVFGFIEHVCVLTGSDMVVAIVMGREGQKDQDPFFQLTANTLAELSGDGSAAPPERKMLGRFIVGAIAELMEHKPARYTQRGSSALRYSKRTREPEVRTFELKRDVVVDCREHVQRFLRGGGSGQAPTVQRLVIGHWKRQVHGRGRAERKWLFVQPYWRGPEDAPIAMRSHVVKVPERKE